MIKVVQKYKEIILYLIFGVLTTVVNILSYALFTRILKIDIYTSNVIAWVLCVLFAYVTNRKYVFNSKAVSFNEKFKELVMFYGSRLITFAIDMALMYMLIDLFKLDDMFSKIAVNGIIIILNYVFSKLIVFREKR